MQQEVIDQVTEAFETLQELKKPAVFLMPTETEMICIRNSDYNVVAEIITEFIDGNEEMQEAFLKVLERKHPRREPANESPDTGNDTGTTGTVAELQS